MAFNTSNDNEDLMSEINMTPLVDVMLVLLIIFIIAMPILQHAVKIDLPQATTQVQDKKVKDVNIVIDAHGVVTWDDKVVDAAALAQIADATAQVDDLTVLHVRADKTTPYEYVAQVMAAVQNAGLTKVGLVTNPK